MRDPVDARTKAIETAIEKVIELVREYLSEAWAMPKLELWLEKSQRRVDALQRLTREFGELEKLAAGLSSSPLPDKPKRPPKKRGRPCKPKARQIQIALTIAILVEHGGLKPTRSHADGIGERAKYPRLSASGIVKIALDRLGERMSERTIEGIWDRHKDAVVPVASSAIGKEAKHLIESAVISDLPPLY